MRIAVLITARRVRITPVAVVCPFELRKFW